MNYFRTFGIVSVLCVLVLAATSAWAATVDWKGYTWDNNEYGGNTLEVVDGNLVVTNDAHPYGADWYHGGAGYNTDAAFRSQATPWIQATAYDNYTQDPWLANGGPCLYAWGVGWVTRIEATPAQSQYTITEHFDSVGTWDTYYPGVWRNPEWRQNGSDPVTFKIGRAVDGKLQYYIDGVLVRTSTAAFSGPILRVSMMTFGNPVFGYGTTTPNPVTFTDYQASVPEPSSLLSLSAALPLGLTLLRRRRLS